MDIVLKKNQILKIKTLCFPLSPNKAQVATLECWLERLRWVWNDGLRLLLEQQEFSRGYSTTADDGKKQFGWAPCCPLPWQYRRIDKEQPWQDGNYAPYSPISSDRRWKRGNPVFCCPLPQDYRKPQIQRLDVKGDQKQKLFGWFAHKRHPDKQWLRDIPANFIRGTLASLAESWERYKAGKAKCPKFKSKRDVGDTLINLDSKTIEVNPLTERDALIAIPKLGKYRVKYLWEDWGNTVIRSLKIAKKPGRWELQLTGDIPSKEFAGKYSTSLVIQPEEGIIAVRDDGVQYLPPSPDPKLEQRLKTLQEALARRKPGSSYWLKTKEKIAKIHALQSARGRNKRQKNSTFLARVYGEIEITKAIKPGTEPKPKRKGKAKTIDPIHYLPNQAGEVAQVNQLRARVASGEFVALLKSKANSLHESKK